MQYSRKVERACTQMEPIMKILDGNDVKSISLKQKRLEFLHSTSPMPFWSVKSVYAKILKSLGCVSVSFFTIKKDLITVLGSLINI